MAAKDENQGSGSRKMTPARTQEQAVRCPRCDSQNTKFCYYNNYSLTQPRHFCKTCRRYWTKGGALRNVPIGGGCRKNKKKTSSRLSGDSKDQYPDTGGLKFFHGLSPAMDFQLGGVSFPSLHPSTTGIYNHFSSQIGSNPCLGLDPSVSSGPLMGATNFPLSPMLKQGDHGAGFSGGIQDMGLNTSNLASSIESLSSINQDLHWKLQQQRLAMLESIQNQKERPQPILFQNLEISKPASSFGGMQNNSRREGENGNLATEWLFDDNSSYANIRNSSGNESTSNWNNGLQGWSTTSSNQYTSNFP